MLSGVCVCVCVCLFVCVYTCSLLPREEDVGLRACAPAQHLRLHTFVSFQTLLIAQPPGLCRLGDAMHNMAGAVAPHSVRLPRSRWWAVIKCPAHQLHVA